VLARSTSSEPTIKGPSAAGLGTGFGAQITISGNRPQQNRYVVDGITINDYSNSAPGSVLGLDLGAEAVEQVTVVTSDYPAEYGRSSGGVVNAVTHPATNPLEFMFRSSCSR